jgi:hypothetical protein
VALDDAGCAVPAAIDKKVTKALESLAGTGAKKKTKGKQRALQGVVRTLLREIKVTDRLARKKRLAPDCASRLRATLEDARVRVGGLLSDLNS